MREIKFRYYYQLQAEKDANNSGFGIWPDSGADIDYIMSDSDYTVVQYTGLRDRNGVEVYEDDLWRFDDITYLVLWIEKHAKFSIVAIDLNNKHTGEILSPISLRKGEVIGSIHGNPELLKVGDGEA